jgi:hypothetical protein
MKARRSTKLIIVRKKEGFHVKQGIAISLA